MKNRLQLLCGKFYIPQLIAESGQKVETCRRLLAGRLDKSDRKLVLWITVIRSLITEKHSVGRSICGLRLAQEMRLNCIMMNRAGIPLQMKELTRDACSVLLQQETAGTIPLPIPKGHLGDDAIR